MHSLYALATILWHFLDLITLIVNAVKGCKWVQAQSQVSQGHTHVFVNTAHWFVWIRLVCLYSTAFVDQSHSKHANRSLIRTALLKHKRKWVSGIRLHGSSSLLEPVTHTMLSDSSCFQCVLLFKHSPSNTRITSPPYFLCCLCVWEDATCCTRHLSHAVMGSSAGWRVFESFIYTRQHSLHFIGSDRRGCDGWPSRLLLLFTSPWTSVWI